MLIDLHVHTSRYSPCGNSTPEEMVVQALEYGLQGLVFTEHNVLWPAEELQELRGRYPQIRLLCGVELTSDAGDDYLVYGITERGVFEPQMQAFELIRRVRARGGIVVLAHPYRYGPSVPTHLSTYPVDGVEILSGNILNYAHPKARDLCERLGTFPVASSDAHLSRMVGLYALDFRRAIADERELAAALRERDFSLYTDIARVAAENATVAAQFGEARRLVALGYDNRTIRDQVRGMSLGIVQGIRDGLDVRRPG